MICERRAFACDNTQSKGSPFDFGTHVAFLILNSDGVKSIKLELIIKNANHEIFLTYSDLPK